MYQEAADKGCVLAQNYLGCLFYNHDKDFSKAVQYFKMAAEKDCKKAQHNLGVCYEQGEIEYI